MIRVHKLPAEAWICFAYSICDIRKECMIQIPTKPVTQSVYTFNRCVTHS